MLDKHAEQMLNVASTLTAEDLDYLRASAPAEAAGSEDATLLDRVVAGGHIMPAKSPSQGRVLDPNRGERERQRTRESKISTQCVGSARVKHEWWPLGTELVGRIGSERFTAKVVENPQVKSGRSIRLTSGAAQGRICLTPTRAALEATEAYREARGLGRSGGVTNGWTFWSIA